MIKEKGGQMAIIIIIALVLVSIVFVVFLYPKLAIGLSDINPTQYLKSCIEPEAKNAMEILSKQGGYLEPTHYVNYEGEKVQYLCYTSENYVPCSVQQPLLKSHVENEIEVRVEPIAMNCLKDLKDEYERRGYAVTLTEGELNVALVPTSLVIEFFSSIVVVKEDSQAFRKFTIDVKTELYDLILIATNIIQFESTLGDSEINLYTQYYPDLKIEKIKKEEDTIYKLKNVVTEDEFIFASRSLVWPQGYGLEEL